MNKSKANDMLNSPMLHVLALGPNLIGRISYEIGKRLFRFFLKRYKSCYFWLCFTFGIFLVVFTCYIFEIDLWLADKFRGTFFPILDDYLLSKIYYWFHEYLHFPAKLALRLSKFLLMYGKYSILLSPIWAIFIVPKQIAEQKQNKMGRSDDVKNVIIKPKLFKKYRDNVDGAFLGIDKSTKEPVSLTDAEMNKHVEILGPTGAGKTESVFLPLIDYHIRSGKGLVIIDGKAKKELEYQTRAIVKKYGREDDFKFFSLSNPSYSMNYNPFKNGIPTELKDQFIGSQIWSDYYYKVIGEQVLQHIFNTFRDQNIVPTFELLERVFTNPHALGFTDFKNKQVEEHFKIYCETYKKNKDKFSGLAANIHAIAGSDFGTLFKNSENSINLLEGYDNNQIIYFQLPSTRFEETVKRIGRMILYDLKSVCSKIQNRISSGEKKYFPVLIDEADQFMYTGFNDLLLQARDAGVGIAFVHHGIGDLNNVSKNFTSSVLQNTNCKIIMRLDDPEAIERFCRSAGTRSTIKYTYQTEESILGRSMTGNASMREVDEFRIDPNEFRELQVGHAIVLVGDGRRLHRVQLDHLIPDTSDVVVPEIKTENITNEPMKEERMSANIDKNFQRKKNRLSNWKQDD